jgi:hypothetical protein
VNPHARRILKFTPECDVFKVIAELSKSFPHVTSAHGDKECVGMVNFTGLIWGFFLRVETHSEAIGIRNDNAKA